RRLRSRLPAAVPPRCGWRPGARRADPEINLMSAQELIERPQVVVLGAGFAGVAALRKLRRAPVDVTLVDRNDYHAFLPLLYQVATNQLGSDSVSSAIDELIGKRKGWRFAQGEVTRIDLTQREIEVAGHGSISYDYLLLGLGARVNFYGTPGAAEHAFPL